MNNLIEISKCFHLGDDTITKNIILPVGKRRVLVRGAYHIRVHLDLSLSSFGTDHNVHVSSISLGGSETKPERKK